MPDAGYQMPDAAHPPRTEPQGRGERREPQGTGDRGPQMDAETLILPVPVAPEPVPEPDFGPRLAPTHR